jgi:four helix bundle protein
MTTTPAALKARTKQFAVRIVAMADVLPRSTAAKVIANQVLRSGTSVAANYRAACRARSRAEFLAKLGIVEEEADETLFWLELIVATSMLPAKRLQPLLEEADQLTAIFVASRKTARDGNRQSKIENRK